MNKLTTAISALLLTGVVHAQEGCTGRIQSNISSYNFSLTIPELFDDYVQTDDSMAVPNFTVSTDASGKITEWDLSFDLHTPFLGFPKIGIDAVSNSKTGDTVSYSLGLFPTGTITGTVGSPGKWICPKIYNKNYTAP